MAFGVITKVWGCLRHDYVGALENAKRLLTAIFVLHNFRINCSREAAGELDDIETGTVPERGLRPHTHAVGAEFRHPLDTPTLEGEADEDGSAGPSTSYDPNDPSFMRDAIVEELQRRGLRRYNENVY